MQGAAPGAARALTSARLARREVEQVTIDFSPARAVEIRERKWHRSQSLAPLDGGGLRLTREVAGVTEEYPAAEAAIVWRQQVTVGWRATTPSPR